MIARAASLIVERPFRFHPLDGVAGHAIRLRERIHILLVRTVHARAEEPRVIGADHFAGGEEHLNFVNAWLRAEIKCANGPVRAAA